MSSVAATFPSHATTGLALVIVWLPASWGCFALWYQVRGGRARKSAAVALWTSFCLAMLLALWQNRFAVGIIGFGVTFSVLLIWWHRRMPSNSRLWADDVAEMTTGTAEAGRVTLFNVRNFDWRTRTDYTPRWETRSYELD